MTSVTISIRLTCCRVRGLRLNHFKMGSNSSCEDDSPSRCRENSKISNWFRFTSPGRSCGSSNTKSPKSDRNINVFQRVKKKFEKHFPGYRGKCGCSLTTFEWPTNRDCTFSAEENNKGDREEESWKMLGTCAGKFGDETAMDADEQRKALRKKLLDVTTPNLVMYRACIEMLSYAWYWGDISRHQAQRQLTDKKDGSFLIRNSEKDGSQFTLSFRMWNRTLHYRIQYHENYWHFEARKYESMVEMVENFMNRSHHEMFYVQRASDILPPFPVVLRYPISRYLKFVTLQDLCRRVIQRNIRKEDVDCLPIPVQLKDYLADDIESIAH